MQIPTNAALLAAQSFASAQPAQAPRPTSAARRIEAFDLTDLGAKPNVKAAAPPVPEMQRNLIAAAVEAASRSDVPAPRAEQRPARPGSTLDIKV